MNLQTSSGGVATLAPWPSAHSVLSPLTSLIQPPPPVWTALLATPPLALELLCCQTALPVLLASTSQMESAPPALPPSTSLTLPPPPVWTALLATPPLALELLCCQTALPVLLANTSQMESAHPVLSPLTSLPLPRPPAWSAQLAALARSAVALLGALAAQPASFFLTLIK